MQFRVVKKKNSSQVLQALSFSAILAIGLLLVFISALMSRPYGPPNQAIKNIHRMVDLAPRF